MVSVLTWPSWRPVQPLHRTCQPGFVQNGIKKQMDCVSASPSDAHCRHSNSASALHCIPGMCSLSSTTTILTRPQAIAQVFLLCLSGYYLAWKGIADKRTQKVFHLCCRRRVAYPCRHSTTSMCSYSLPRSSSRKSPSSSR